MFINYQAQVLRDYHKKRDSNSLSLNLTAPTSAKLRRESAIVCSRRYERRDERALNAFFGQGADKADFLREIERFDPDKFKPLVNYLKRVTNDTEVKNVELLAWLIDFKDRPYEFGKSYDLDTPVEPATKQTGSQDADEDKGVSPPEGPGDNVTPVKITRQPTIPGSRLRRVIIVVVIMALAFTGIGTGIYWGRSNKASPIILSGPIGCMYWADDHYQQIPCNQRLGDTLVVALDSEKLAHFKKITQPDTITAASMGKVWYVKINGGIEFYTSTGFHPVDPRLRLKPITEYMIRKHVHPSQ